MRVGLLLLLALASCSVPAQPYAYRDNKEMTGSPGLFTGANSELTVYRR